MAFERPTYLGFCVLKKNKLHTHKIDYNTFNPNFGDLDFQCSQSDSIFLSLVRKDKNNDLNIFEECFELNNLEEKHEQC